MLVWIPTWVVLTLFGRFRKYGKENLKGLSRGVIFAANHQSELDPILVPASLNPFSAVMPIFYVARERAFYKKSSFNKYFYGGRWFKLWGAYPAYTGKKDYAYSLQEHVKILNAGKSLLVFPEGEKMKNGEVGNGKGGIAFLSHATGAPIVPLAMRGHFKMTGKDFFLRRRTILLNFGKPIYPMELFSQQSDPTPDEYKTAAQIVMGKIAELHKTISAK